VINSPAWQCHWDRRRVRYCPCPRGRPHSRAHIGRPAYGAAPVQGPTHQLDSSRTEISETQWEPVVEDFVQCTLLFKHPGGGPIFFYAPKREILEIYF